MNRFCLALVALMSLSVVSLAQADTSTQSPRIVAHLLDYLSKDYAGAVSDTGQILSQSEYAEQTEFAASALTISSELPETRNQAELIAGIQKLKGLIDSKAKPSEVSVLAVALKQQVIQIARISQVPDQWPSLAHGKELFQRNCTSCHGINGAGDGPSGRFLDPKPTNFLDAQVGLEINPFRAFNTIRVGIPGTGMAAWPMFADQDVWDMAFYVTSLHLTGENPQASVSNPDLTLVATQSDAELMTSLSGTEEEKKDKIVALRLHSGEGTGVVGGGTDSVGSTGAESGGTLPIARSYLRAAEKSYEAQDYTAARHHALLAYLEGIEPVEPRLRANDAAFVIELEGKMAAVRATIEARQSFTVLQANIGAANLAIDAAESRMSAEPPSPWITFVLTVGILLREGFEAVLILVALLAVIRASGVRKAARWVHAGWIVALAMGLMAWFFSGWLMLISGAQREMLEAVTSLLAVAVLLYLGFWLHSRTEISRWNHFIEGQVKTMLEGSNLWGLFAISFMAVFREAFETVLFMRAITLEGGAAGTAAMGLGVVVSLVGIFIMSWMFLKYSARLPIRKIFSVSSALMAVLAWILTGKGLHSLQETGALGVTPSWWNSRIDFLGIYPTWETLIPQFVVLAIVFGLWQIGKRPSLKH